MARVRREVEAHATKMRFYVPGTKGFAKTMRLFGYIMFAGSLVSILGNMAGFSDYMTGRPEIFFSMAIMSAMLFLFSRIMPKHAPFGNKQFAKLAGFEEFILRAEKDKLEELVNTNPDYFGMTLPYAIALGVATKWVAHFEGMAVKPPSYYKSQGENSDHGEKFQ